MILEKSIIFIKTIQLKFYKNIINVKPIRKKDYDIKQKYNHQDDVISFADILLVVAPDQNYYNHSYDCMLNCAYKCFVFFNAGL